MEATTQGLAQREQTTTALERWRRWHARRRNSKREPLVAPVNSSRTFPAANVNRSSTDRWEVLPKQYLFASLLSASMRPSSVNRPCRRGGVNRSERPQHVPAGWWQHSHARNKSAKKIHTSCVSKKLMTTAAGSSPLPSGRSSTVTKQAEGSTAVTLADSAAPAAVAHHLPTAITHVDSVHYCAVGTRYHSRTTDQSAWHTTFGRRSPPPAPPWSVPYYFCPRGEAGLLGPYQWPQSYAARVIRNVPLRWSPPRRDGKLE